MKNIGLLIATAVVASACGNSSNPLRSYPEINKLQPRATAKGPEQKIIYVDMPVEKRVPEYIERVKEIEVKVPDYVEKKVIIDSDQSLFSVAIPGSRLLEFMTGRNYAIPIQVKALKGQVEFEVELAQPTLAGMELRPTKTEPNNRFYDLVFAPSASLLQGKALLKGTLNLKMKVNGISDADPRRDQELKQLAKIGSHTYQLFYVIEPGGQTAETLESTLAVASKSVPTELAVKESVALNLKGVPAEMKEGETKSFVVDIGVSGGGDEAPYLLTGPAVKDGPDLGTLIQRDEPRRDGEVWRFNCTIKTADLDLSLLRKEGTSYFIDIAVQGMTKVGTRSDKVQIIRIKYSPASSKGSGEST